MLSLRTKILLTVSIFIVVIGAGFVLYSIFTTKAYKQLRMESLAFKVESRAETVNKSIRIIESAAMLYAQSALICKEVGSDKVTETLVVDYLSRLPIVISAGFWYEPFVYQSNRERAAFFAYIDEDTGQARFDRESAKRDYYYHDKEWYHDIVENTKSGNIVRWTRPYLDDTATHTWLTTAGTSVFDRDGQLLAISTVDWKIQGMIDELSELKPTPGSFVVLCSPEGGYVITKTHESFNNETDLEKLPSYLFDSNFMFEGKHYYSFDKWLDNGWLISINVPEDEIFAEVELQNKNFTIILTLIILVLLALSYYFINEFINKPIHLLSVGVNQIASGELDAKIPVNSTDELGILAFSFNSMISKLKLSLEVIAKERTEKERMETELNIATKIQASMLPHIFPPFPNRPEFDIYASMTPAKQIGGDFYDFYMIDDYTLAFVIADVSGKGIPAALFMVITQTLIKNNVQLQKSPKEVFELVNNMLCIKNEESMFVTAFLGYLKLNTGQLNFVNAGHNSPLLKSRTGEDSSYRYDWLDSNKNFILAVIENIEYEEHEIFLNIGDELFLYTDGVTEAMNKDKELYSDPKLLETVNKNISLNPKEFCITIKKDVDKFIGEEETADDITMLSLRYLGKRELES